MLRQATRSERERDVANAGVITANSSAKAATQANNSRRVNAGEVFLKYDFRFLHIYKIRPLIVSQLEARVPVPCERADL